MEAFECSQPLDAPLPACDAKIAVLHRYWCSIRPGDGLLPGRQHLDPTEIPSLLPWVWLCDVHRDPVRFKYRLFGTELVRLVGYDPTGTWLDDRLATLNPGRSRDHLVFVAEGQGISYCRGFAPLLLPEKNHISSERIVLPLARNGSDVDILLGFSIYHHAPATSRARRAIPA
jgi:hypothetical protein